MAAFVLPHLFPFPMGTLSSAVNLVMLYGIVATFIAGALIAWGQKRSNDRLISPRLAFYSFSAPAILTGIPVVIFAILR